MARALSASVISALGSPSVKILFFVQIDFVSATVYLWNGYGNFGWNSQTWIGLGQFAQISPMGEDVDVAAAGVTLSLTGLPTKEEAVSSLLSKALTECRQGKAVKVWFGFQSDSGTVVPDPFQSFAGRMDVPSIDEGAETCSISISVENSLIDLQRSRERRYTHDDQQLDYGQPVAISSISRTSNVVTVNTTGNHGFDINGQTVVIAGVTPSSFNGSFALTVVDADTFTYPQTAANDTGSGGTATVPDKGFEYVPAVQDWNGIWGKGTAVPRGGPISSPTGSGGTGSGPHIAPNLE